MRVTPESRRERFLEKTNIELYATAFGREGYSAHHEDGEVVLRFSDECTLGSFLSTATDEDWQKLLWLKVFYASLASGPFTRGSSKT